MSLPPLRFARTAAALVGLLLASVAVAAPDSLVLKMPGQPDKTIAPDFLLGRGSMDVRLEDVQGNVTIYHGTPLLEVLEKNGLDVRTMAGERKSAAAVVLVRARDGYTVAFSIGELRNNRSNPKVFLVAETADGPLPDNEGPIRTVTYGDPVRSPYALGSIELKTLVENPTSKKP
jgi:hypothetical protein